MSAVVHLQGRSGTVADSWPAHRSANLRLPEPAPGGRHASEPLEYRASQPRRTTGIKPQRWRTSLYVVKGSSLCTLDPATIILPLAFSAAVRAVFP